MKRFFTLVIIAISFIVYSDAQTCNKEIYKEIEKLVKAKPFELFKKIRTIKYEPDKADQENYGYSPDWDTWIQYVVCSNQYINAYYPDSIFKEYIPLLIKIREHIEQLTFYDIDLSDKELIDNYKNLLLYDTKITNYIFAKALRAINKDLQFAIDSKEKNIKASAVFPQYEKFFKTFNTLQSKQINPFSTKSIKEILQSKELGIDREKSPEESRTKVTDLFNKLEILRIALENDTSWFGKSERAKKIMTIDRINNAILREYNLIIPFVPPIPDSAYGKLDKTKNIPALIIAAEARTLNYIILQLITYLNKFLK